MKQNNIILSIILFIAYAVIKTVIVFICSVFWLLLLGAGIDIMLFLRNTYLWETMQYLMIVLLSCLITSPILYLMCKGKRKSEKILLIVLDVVISIIGLAITAFVIRL